MPMSIADVINLAEKHLLAQKEYAVERNPNGGAIFCHYLQEGTGLKCAIGGLPGVTEALEGVDHFNTSAQKLYQDVPAFAALFDLADPYVLSQVQAEMHDNLTHEPFSEDKVRQAATRLRERFL